jgi:type VI secretion system VgrG family protein
MIELDFVSNAMPHDTFQVLRFEGEEEISSLFRFEITLVSRDSEIDYKTIMDATASLSVTTQQRTRHIHGMLAHFTQQEEWHSGLYIYKAVIVPRLWMMSRSQQNQISQKKTIIEIIENELGESDNKGNHPLVKLGLQFDDYEISANNRSYPSREYVVQYKETDLNFISRLMEHEGIYYFFEHDEVREKLIITDSHSLLEKDDEEQYVAYQPGEKINRYDSSVIYKLESEFQHVTSKILVKDYNYRTPHLDIQGEGLPEVDGIGFVSEYGSHAKSPEEADEYALIRTEEALCEKTIYVGESNDAGFACGKEYTLFQHFRYEFNKTCMLTKVRHFASQDIESWGTVGGTQYHNEFTSIPADVQYRPKRKTPKPVMHGIMNGKIDSEMGDIDRADIDEEGRYKVSMPFDISDAARGKASRRIRMAQPYGGQGAGMSFPLAPGTEVIWTCIDGDIDRPIITGTVPNPLNPSVTTTDNSNSNVIKTASGMTMSFHDGLGSGAGASPSSEDDALTSQQQNQGIDTVFQAGVSPVVHTDTTSSFDASTEFKNKGLLSPQQQYMSYDMDFGGSGARRSPLKGKQYAIIVPNYDNDTDTAGAFDTKDTFLRLGKATKLEQESDGDWSKDGWLDFTDGDHISIVKGERIDHTTEKSTTIAEGTTYSYGISRALSYSMSNSFKSTTGISGSAKTGLEVETNIGVKASMFYGAEFKFGTGASFTFSNDTSVEVSKDKKFDLNERFWAKIDPPDNDPVVPGFFKKFGSESYMENEVPTLAKRLALASSAVSASMSTAADCVGEPTGTSALNTLAEVHAGLVYAAGAYLSVGALSYAKGQSSSHDEPCAELDLLKGTYSVPAKPATPSFTDNNPAAHLHVFKSDGDSTVSLMASKEYSGKDGKDLARVLLKEDGTAGKASVNISALKADKGPSIDLLGDVEAKSHIVLQVGDSKITMTKDSIHFKAKSFTFDADGKADALTITNAQVDLPDGVNFVTKGNVTGANITATAKIEGPEITANTAKLGASPGSGDSSAPPTAPTEVTPAKWKLVDGRWTKG